MSWLYSGAKLDRVQVEAVRDGEHVVTLCVGATPEQFIGLVASMLGMGIPSVGSISRLIVPECRQ